MRTTLNINDRILLKAAEMTGVKEKTSLVHMGLEALIALEREAPGESRGHGAAPCANSPPARVRRAHGPRRYIRMGGSPPPRRTRSPGPSHRRARVDPSVRHRRTGMREHLPAGANSRPSSILALCTGGYGRGGASIRHCPPSLRHGARLDRRASPRLRLPHVHIPLDKGPKAFVRRFAHPCGTAYIDWDTRIPPLHESGLSHRLAELAALFSASGPPPSAARPPTWR